MVQTNQNLYAAAQALFPFHGILHVCVSAMLFSGYQCWLRPSCRVRQAHCSGYVLSAQSRLTNCQTWSLPDSYHGKVMFVALKADPGFSSFFPFCLPCAWCPSRLLSLIVQCCNYRFDPHISKTASRICFQLHALCISCCGLKIFPWLKDANKLWMHVALHEIKPFSLIWICIVQIDNDLIARVNLGAVRFSFMDNTKVYRPQYKAPEGKVAHAARVTSLRAYYWYRKIFQRG